jgi:hypothetical protein
MPTQEECATSRDACRARRSSIRMGGAWARDNRRVQGYTHAQQAGLRSDAAYAVVACVDEQRSTITCRTDQSSGEAATGGNRQATIAKTCQLTLAGRVRLDSPDVKSSAL